MAPAEPDAVRVADPAAPGLAWTPVSIPGAADPVHLVRLHAGPVTRASVSLVRFPAGWSRPGTGRCTCAEEIVVPPPAPWPAASHPLVLGVPVLRLAVGAQRPGGAALHRGDIPRKHETLSIAMPQKIGLPLTRQDNP